MGSNGCMGSEAKPRTLNICEAAGTQRYRSKAIADKTAVRRSKQLKREMAAYSCASCGGWHLKEI